MTSILKAKITSPKAPPGIIRREMLIHRIKKSLDRNFIIVHSPAGFGKTTAVLDLLHSENLFFSWLQISEEMNEMEIFMNYLIHSLAEKRAEFGKNIPENAGIIEVASGFLNELQEHFDDDLFIVLDDFESISGAEWIKDFFGIISKNLPPNIHFIITTRIPPELDYSYLSSKRKLFKTSLEDLTFTKAETEQLLKQVYDLILEDEELEILYSKTGGWITALHLIVTSHGKNSAGVLKKLNKLDENLYNLFAGEYFDRLDKNMREFLLSTSAAESFDIKLANILTGSQNSFQAINYLRRKNFFINSAIVEESGKMNEIFFYHQLFRDFLLEKLHEMKDKNAIRSLNKRIYGYYLGKNKILTALKYGIEAGDFDKVLPLLKKNFDNLFERGNYSELWKRINEIGEKKLYSNPYLIYFKSLLERFYKNDQSAALEDANKAIGLFKKIKDEEFLIRCYISKTRILLNKGSTDEAIKELSSLSKKKLQPKNLVKVINHIALAYYLKSELDKALGNLERSFALLKKNRNDELKNWAYNLTGNIYLLRGEYTKAIQQYEQIKEKSTDLRTRFGTLCNLVLCYSQTGNFTRANENLFKLEEILKENSTPVLQLNYFIARQAFHFEQCEYPDAVTIQEQMLDLALKTGHQYYIFLGYRLLADSYYYSDKLSKAGEFYLLAKKYIDKDNELEAAELDYANAVLNKKIKLNPKSRPDLKRAYKFFDLKNYVYNKAQAAFHLADANLKAGFTEEGKNLLEESLTLCYENEYIPFLTRELISGRSIFDFAIENKIKPDFAKLIFETLFERKESLESSQSSGWLREKIEELYDLKMNAFGILEFKVRGKTVSEDQWVKKKRKVILIYLLLSPNNDITKDKLIELFYPDTPLESVENIFHQTVSRIRNILTIDEDKKEKKKSAKGGSLLIYEDKVLKLDMNYNYYSDSFEFDKHYLRYSLHDLQKGERIDVMKKAVDLYKGQFLEGYYETWIEDLRQDYNNKFISICTDLILTLKDELAYEDVISYAGKLITFDELNEDAYLSLIEAYKRIGNLKAAEDVKKNMIKKYKKAINEDPPEDLMKSIEEILKR